MGIESGYKTKDQPETVRTPQEMSDEAISVYRETERKLREKIKEAQGSLDQLTAKISKSSDNLASLNSKIAGAQGSLNELTASYQTKLSEMKKESDAYFKEKEESASDTLKRAQELSSSNAIESARLAGQRNEQETARQEITNARAILNAEKIEHKVEKEKCDAQFEADTAGINKKIAENTGLLQSIETAKKENESLLQKIEDRKASNLEIDKKIAENAVLLAQVKEAREAQKTKQAELDAKENNLRASAEAQDNIKNQIQLRQDTLDAGEEDLRNRKKICAEQEAQLVKRGV